jgi:hypothetical protein
MEAGHMYRIRSASGTEAVFNSLEEFTAAVRRGEVAPEDEIFHSRANRWLDVKSHPHYRSAINWSGPLSADSIFSGPATAVPPAAPPKPVPHAAPAHNGQARLQIAEIPAAPKPAATTVYRPQLVSDKPASAPQASAPPAPAPAAPPPAPPAPVVKSKEIPFIDVGPAAPAPRQNATIIEARKPPVAPPVAPPARAAKEPEFLVMDQGMERPARASNGHRTVTGDADALFDTPLADAKPPVPAATSVQPTQTKPEPPEPPKVPAKPAQIVPATPPTPAPKAPVVADRPRSTPMPGTVAAPVPPRISAPVPAFTRIVAEDLDIPGPPLLESPLLALSPATQPTPTTVSRRSMGMVIGTGAIVMVAAGAVMLWRPWSHHGTGEVATGSASAASSMADSPTVTVTEATTTPPLPAPTKPGPTGLVPPKSGDAAVPADSAGGDQILAATRPNFHTDVPVPSADLDLSADVATGPAVTVVAPSELARRLEAAEKLAQQDLSGKLGPFHNVLVASRLSSTEGVSQARIAWNNGADAIRQYRARIARLEQGYEDSVLASQRAKHWTAEEMRGWAMHQSLAEPAETSQLADLMLSQVAEGFDNLAALDGQYEVKNGTLRFKNPASATRYLSIRTWVEQRMQAWNGTPEGARPTTVSLMLRALGDGFPPVE